MKDSSMALQRQNMLLHKNKSESSIQYSLLLLLAVLIISLIFYNIGWVSSEAKIFFFSWVGTLSFVVCIILYYRTANILFCPYIFFFLSFFVFQFGQFFLFGLGYQYDYFFQNYYANLYGNNTELLILSMIFVIFSFIIFNLFAIYATKRKQNQKKVLFHIQNNTSNNKAFKIVAYFLLMVSIVPTIMIRYQELSIVIKYGYLGLYENPLPVNFLTSFEIFFIPSLIMLYIVYRKRLFTSIILIIMMVLYAAVLFFIGGRTKAVSLLVVLCLFFLLNRKKALKISTLVIFAILLLFISGLAVTISDVRVDTDQSAATFLDNLFQNIFMKNILFEMIGELGWTGSNLPFTMEAVHKSGFGYGISYFGAIINIIPTSIDFTGVVEWAAKYANLESWLTETLGLSFGSGFSMVAEAYYNFGMFGIPVFCVLGYIIGRFLFYQKNDIKTKSNFDIYLPFVALYGLFTFPRRTTLYFIDQVLYLIVLVFLLVKICNYFLRRTKCRIPGQKTQY